jgi:hypothetical protein
MSSKARRIEILPPLQGSADELSELEWLVDLMDSRFQIPGTTIRLGLDAILGLVPGIGDGVSALVSAFIFQQLRKHKLPWYTQARMIGNILLDFTLGAVPLVGDLLDIGFKANRANVSLARKHLKKSRASAYNMPAMRT